MRRSIEAGYRQILTLSLAVWLGLAVGPACAQDDAGGERSVTVNGVERVFVVHLPTNLPRPAPVVFVFHGAGGRPEAIAHKTGMDEVADQQGFIVLYPAGTTRDSGRRGTWNVGRTGGRESSGDLAIVSSDDVAFVRAILHDIERMTPIDHDRIYATGFSMGGIFTYRLACEMSETFAAVAPVSATMVEPSCRPHSPVAILHLHGADDDRIPLSGGRGEMTGPNRSWPAPQQGVSSWSRLDNCAGDPTVSDDAQGKCTTYNQCRATVEYCVIAGGGHAWPEGASERIWSFFAAHPKQTN